MAKETKDIFVHGLRDGIPIALGYYAVAFSLGIIASSAGIGPLLGFISSAFIRASAGEYCTYTLAAAGATYVEVIGMSIIANVRYMLMGAALSQKFSKTTAQWKRILVSCCITDEVFGISIAYPGKLAPAYTFGAAVISTLGWASGTASGIIAGDILPTNIVAALSVALYGMFIAIIVPPAKQDKAVGIAVLSSFLLSGLCAYMPYVSEISSGTRVIILTILVSAIAAILKPINPDSDNE